MIFRFYSNTWEITGRFGGFWKSRVLEPSESSPRTRSYLCRPSSSNLHWPPFLLHFLHLLTLLLMCLISLSASVCSSLWLQLKPVLCVLLFHFSPSSYIYSFLKYGTPRVLVILLVYIYFFMSFTRQRYWRSNSVSCPPL